MENIPPNVATTPEKASPKHVFLHLFVIVMLYYSAVNFLILMFQYVNYKLPDRLSEAAYYQLSYSFDLIRFALASMIIVFPIFLIASRFLNKIYSVNRAVREMKTRKWLTYFTLFAAALIMVGDLVSVILTFLQGEMTLRFILKAIAVLFTVGIIFFYYLRGLKEETNAKAMKFFVVGVIVIVVAAVVAGFFVIGSPKTERLRRFDYERAMRLQDIQMQVINYWRSKERLPEKLSDLSDEISGFIASVDPETEMPFEYNVKGPETFELCAVFNLASEGESMDLSYELEPMNYPVGKENWNWKHEAGQTCFERTIDAELYPPYQNQRVK